MNIFNANLPIRPSPLVTSKYWKIAADYSISDLGRFLLTKTAIGRSIFRRQPDFERVNEPNDAIHGVFASSGQVKKRPPADGKVYLMGAGPGDPELLTIRAARLLQQADVIFYDRLVSPEILELCRPGAQRVYVGKSTNQHSVQQEALSELLVSAAKRGQSVVRLKGGDPFIFGRGGEEALALAAQGICFQIVPGITAAVGCGAYAGIPLTHRDLAHSVTFIAGHSKTGAIKVDWGNVAGPGQTLVFYMGLANADEICAKLTENGSPTNTPAALIEQGTTSEQKVIVGDLSNLPQRILDAKAQSPALLIIGDVVGLRSKLQWFETDQLAKPASA